MSRLIWAMVLISILVSSSWAKPAELTAGPYRISFDLKMPLDFDQYNSSIHDNQSSIYMARAISDNKTAVAFAITRYKQPQNAAFDSQRTAWLLMKALAESGQIQDPTMTDQQIDGRAAQVQTYRSGELGEGSVITLAQLWLDARVDDCCGLLVGTTKVEMRSEMDREASLALLDTLNITISEPFNVSGGDGLAEEGTSASELDSRCQKRWLSLGYSDSIIRALGFCQKPV